MTKTLYAEKPLSVRWLALLTAALLVLTVAFCSGCTSGNGDSADSSKTDTEQSTGTDGGEARNSDEAVEKDQPSAGLTEEEKSSASEKASSLLRVHGFSQVGLANYMVEFEGFSQEAADYAAENCGADWNEQAVRVAKYYLSTQSMDRADLVGQLEYEGFTTAQAEHGADGAGL